MTCLHGSRRIRAFRMAFASATPRIRVFVDILARRSEVAGLKIGDVRRGKHADLSNNDQPAGMLFLARSKTDQEGAGAWCGISPATVSAVSSWIEFAELDDEDAPLFRALNRDGTIRASSAGHLSGESMNEMINRHVRRSGILAARTEIESNISAHSIDAASPGRSGKRAAQIGRSWARPLGHRERDAKLCGASGDTVRRLAVSGAFCGSETLRHRWLPLPAACGTHGEHS